MLLLFPTLRPVIEVMPTRWEDRIGVGLYQNTGLMDA